MDLRTSGFVVFGILTVLIFAPVFLVALVLIGSRKARTAIPTLRDSDDIVLPPPPGGEFAGLGRDGPPGSEPPPDLGRELPPPPGGEFAGSGLDAPPGTTDDFTGDAGDDVGEGQA